MGDETETGSRALRWIGIFFLAVVACVIGYCIGLRQSNMASARALAAAFYRDQMSGRLDLAEQMMYSRARPSVTEYEQSEGRVQNFVITGADAEILGVPYLAVARVTRSGKTYNETVGFTSRLIDNYVSVPEGTPPGEIPAIKHPSSASSGF